MSGSWEVIILASSFIRAEDRCGVCVCVLSLCVCGVCAGQREEPLLQRTSCLILFAVESLHLVPGTEHFKEEAHQNFSHCYSIVLVCPTQVGQGTEAIYA